jgi:inorganic triphosphatase YgiF
MNEEIKSTEIELKLVLPGLEAEAAVVACLRENDYTVEDLEAVRNVDTYLDTFDWSLMKNKLSLRYRVSNRAAGYTLKSIGPIEDGIARRMETEIPLDGPVDVPTVIPVKRIRKFVDGIVFPRNLLEQIQVRTDRRRYRVISPEGADVELCFDTSSFSLKGFHKRRRTQKLDELEAEILTGPETALEALFSLLSKKFKYSPSRTSKFEVAIERFKITVPSKKPPERLRVRLDDRPTSPSGRSSRISSNGFANNFPACGSISTRNSCTKPGSQRGACVPACGFFATRSLRLWPITLEESSSGSAACLERSVTSTFSF